MLNNYKEFLTFRWSRLLTLLALLLPLVGRGQVVISQVYPGGGSGAAGTTYQRDYVELFNRGTAAVDINGYAIQYQAAATTTGSYTVNALPASIPLLQPGQYYLVVLGSAGAAGAVITTADYNSAVSTSSLAAAAGKLALTSNATALAGGTATTPPASAAVVDFVGYGTTASAYEGAGRAPVPTAGNASSLFRAGNGCTDTNANSADFSNGTPVLRNTSTALAPCGALPTPAEINVKQGTTTYLTASTYSGFASTATGSTDTKTFTIENLGGTVLNISSIVATGDFAVTGTVPTTAAAGSTASVSVTFTPTTTGTRTGTLTIANDDSDESSYVINLSAVAVASTPNPEINVQVAGTDYLTGSTYAFGSTQIGTPVGPVTFTVQNTSTTDVLTVSAAGVTGSAGAGFSLTAAATPFTVAPASTATFTVSFNPTTSGAKTGTITISNDDQNEATYTISLTGTATNPPPVLTSATPPNLLVGISSPVVLAGTTLSGSTVNFNGGTLTPSSTSATSVSVRIVAPSATAFPVSVTTTSGTSNTVDVTATTPPAGFFEPFESVTQASYVTTAGGVSLALTSGNWTLFQGLLTNSDASDKKNNAQSVRLRGGGYISMDADKTGGAGTVTVNAALYGADAGASFVLEYSTDGGMNYATATGAPAALTGTLTPYTFTLNVAGNVRLRISSNVATAGSNPRIDIDDVQIGDYTAPVCNAPTSPTVSGVTSTTATVSFTGSGSATGYTVTTVPVTTTQTLGAAATSVSFTGLTPSTAYTVSIVSNCAAGATSSAATVGFTTQAATPNPLIALSQAGTGVANGGTYSGFASTTQGSTSAAVTFTISNASTTDALTLGTFALTGPFALSGTAPTSVAAGSSATFDVTFTPTAVGTNTGTLSIPNNSQTNNPYTINLSGQGTAAALPDLTVSTTQPIAGSYHNVTVTSTGRALVIGPLSVSGALVVQAGGVLSQNCQPITGTGSFDLQAGALLGICDQAGISTTGAVGAIQVSGTRTYSPAAGYAYNNPSVAQLTGPGLPAQVFGLGVNNPAGATLSQAVAVVQQVTLQAGDLNTGGQAFTLLSSAAGTAVVDNTGGVVSGTTTVQRYIDNSNPIGYRHYSAPVSNTTVNDLAATGFSPVFNTAYNTSPTPSTVTPFPTVFGYDQNRIATVTSTYGAFDKGFFSPAAGAAMVVNRGYTVNAPTTALVDFVGTLNDGTQNSGTLSRGTDAQAGWQFLGNPYPAPLDWSTVAPAQRPGVDAAMYVFQSSGQYGGSYRSYTNGVGGASPLIGAASGYFVRVSAPSSTGAVNLTNANRTLTFGAQPAFGRGTTDTRPQLQLQLAGTTGLDEAYVYFQAGATAGVDAEFDATKLANPSGLNLATAAGSQALAINGLPVLGSAAVLVPLAVAVPNAGSYRFQAADVANFTGTVTLIDGLNGTRTVLATGSSYAFALAGTSATGRFTLEFRTSGVLATTPAQALAAQTQLFPNPASASFRVQLPLLRGTAAVQATLTNALGQTVLTRSLSAPAGQAIDAEFDVRALAAGVYTLRLHVDGTLVMRKVMVE